MHGHEHHRTPEETGMGITGGRTLAYGLAAAFAMASATATASTLVYCSEGSPDSFNPQLSTSATTMDATSYAIYSQLVRRQPGTSKIVPDIAESWDVSADGMTYTFHLRQGVRFHSNARFTPSRALDADDVVFSFNRMHDPAHPFHKATGGKIYAYYESRGLHHIIDKVEKVDDMTVRFRLKHPEAPFLSHLASPFAVILSAEYANRLLAAGTPNTLDLEPIGSGPFQFVSYQKDAAIRYKAFDQYWAGRVRLDNLVFSITPDATVRYAKLKANECQVMALPKPADLQLMRKDPALDVAVGEGGNVGYIAFNTEKKPFDNKLVRQALNLATDKTRILKTVFQGDGRVAKNPLPPGLWSYNDKIADYPYDPAKAKELLAKAGFPNGFESELWYVPVTRTYVPDGRRIAELIQSDWEKVGVRVKLVTFEWGEYIKRTNLGEHPIAMLGWNSFSDPDDFIGVLLSCDAAKAGGNTARWCNREFEQVYQKTKVTTSQAERTKLFEQAQVIFHEEAPWVPLAHGALFMPMRKGVTGVIADPGSAHDFRDASVK
jgi:dipeptide transport system substrate-binding protein